MISSTQTNHPLAPALEPPQNQSTFDSVEQACARLKSLGLRITKPRVTILSTLFGEQDPISIEDLHQKIHSQSCDLVTVYRCLSVFTNLGLVRRSFAINGTSLYEINRGGEYLFRVTCKNTLKRETLSAEVSQELLRAIQRAKTELEARGYKDFTYNLEFFAQSEAVSSRHAHPLPEALAQRVGPQV